jgi:hypothetical protein
VAHTRDDVLAAAHAAFPEDKVAVVVTALDRYGVERYENERERVQLAILHLSEGSAEKLRQLVDAAKLDYRDVLAWYELGPLSMDEGEKLHHAAREVIDKWSK